MNAKHYSVVWTEVAAQDLERLATYLWDETPFRAGEILDRIVDRAESLQSTPLRGRVPPELKGVSGQEWREVVLSPWRILYRISGRRVEIHGVLDGRRSLQDILLDRLLHS